ncbi:PREDICTED: endocuticle structural glycoprotein SgAbd-2-like [Nicrophorus vespilloides]|uniref:Endocuticle structural glycoprotein SgAbd-2-like n=1 Tax=Nicrophorus vespilloides TaxID=110193 RepID=A0ABM1NG29_NICVS|nr:PREDICTED: endocuticle structural glycoprotein SgAbd-2-like [Nicrophorus vespilloides]
MKLIIFSFLLLSAISYATSQRYGNNIPIIKYNYDPRPDGSYTYEYETGNGIVANENGYPKGSDSQVKQGSYSYTGPDGNRYTINYIADEDGFRAQGAHLPTAPPIPDAILKSLQYNAAHPEEDSSQRRFFK